jgi:demethylmenaquinone methyltransferase/2-methoxy-6-polyprenyl-1,4-benzoquinol methylase
MATILRQWSYQYPWLYDGISRLAALSVGGERRFRQLALQGLRINPESSILDLCCGGGQTTRYLVELSDQVTGLDGSPVALKRAKQAVPTANYREGLAEDLPFDDNSFDLVHTSVALHEMTDVQLQEIFKEVYRVLKPKGVFAFIDLHAPINPLFWPPLAIFMQLFETETAWQLLKMDLIQILEEMGFKEGKQRLYAGGSLQTIQVTCEKL